MKKLMISVLCLSLLAGCLFLPSKAAAAETGTQSIVTPMFTNINSFYNVFNIYEGGEACVDASLVYRNADEARVIIYLQKYVSGNWITIKSFTAMESDGDTYCTGTYIVTSGAQYRMHSLAYVYINGQIVDSTSYTSGPQYY